MKKASLGTALALLFLACQPRITTTELIDTGMVCWMGDDLIIDFQSCLSSSCDTLTGADCTVTLDGSNLTFQGLATIQSQGNECTADCGFVTATCEVPTLDDPAAITVIYGTETMAWDEIPDCQL